jgi:hypothetical protein
LHALWLHGCAVLTRKPTDSRFSWGFNAFFKQAFKYPVLHICRCIHTIALGIFGFQFFQPVYIAGFHAAKPGFSIAKGSLADPHFRANTFNSYTASCCLMEASAWPSKYLFIKFVEFKVAKYTLTLNRSSRVSGKLPFFLSYNG